MTEPREYTKEECQEMFLRHIWETVEYWDTVNVLTTRERLEGLAHSFLASLDGCSGGCPGYSVIPMPHFSDKEYHKERGENWYPDFEPTSDMCDIAGELHGRFFRMEER